MLWKKNTTSPVKRSEQSWVAWVRQCNTLILAETGREIPRFWLTIQPPDPKQPSWSLVLQGVGALLSTVSPLLLILHTLSHLCRVHAASWVASIQTRVSCLDECLCCKAPALGDCVSTLKSINTDFLYLSSSLDPLGCDQRSCPLLIIDVWLCNCICSLLTAFSALCNLQTDE